MGKRHDGHKAGNRHTTLKGAMEKEDPDNWEFVVPAKLKQLYQTKDFGRYAMPDGEMPVCFIVNTDNTGGNSGSQASTMIIRGMDIRYTLFIIDKYAGASHIIKELTISEAEPDIAKSN